MLKQLVALLIVATTILCTKAIRAQSSHIDPIKSIVEYALASSIDGYDEAEELSAHFESLLLHPVVFSDTTKENLDRLLILSDFQIGSVADYIRQFGIIKSAGEIQLIPGFDQELAELIAPFILLEKPASRLFSIKDIANARVQATGRAAVTLQRAKGYYDTTGNRFKGSPFQEAIATNIAVTRGTAAHFHAKKDAGEAGRLSKGFFDSFGASIQMDRPTKNISKIVVGDYRISFGQGLMLSSSYDISSVADPTLQNRKSKLTASRSMNESNFYRGAALEAVAHPYSFTIAYSAKSADGHLSNSDSCKAVKVTTGLHRNEKELQDRSNIFEQMLAARAACQVAKSKVAASYMHSSQQISGTSTSTNLAALDFESKSKGLLIFGEIVSDLRTSNTLKLGATTRISPQAFFTASYKHKSKSTPIGVKSSIGSSQSLYDDESFYAGIKVTPQYGLTAIAYAELYSYKYPKYLVSAPSDGFEAGASLSGKIGTSIECKVRFRHKQGATDIQQLQGNASLTERTKSNRGDMVAKYNINKNAQLTIGTSTGTFKTESQPLKIGYMLYTEGSLSVKKPSIKLYARFTAFDTESWDVALRSYENDLPGMYSTALLYPKGTRAYLMLRYTPSKSVNLWLKVAETVYSEETVFFGQGLDMIEGNRKTEVKMQATLEL